MRMDARDLRALPTIVQGHTANLKIDTGEIRVWLSRCCIGDGERQPIQAEQRINGRWVDVLRGLRSEEIGFRFNGQDVTVFLLQR